MVYAVVMNLKYQIKTLQFLRIERTLEFFIPTFRHLFVAHKKGHLYKCPDCPQEMASLMGLELHRQRIHGVPKQPKLRETIAMQQFKIENN